LALTVTESSAAVFCGHEAAKHVSSCSGVYVGNCVLRFAMDCPCNACFLCRLWSVLRWAIAFLYFPRILMRLSLSSC